MNFRLSAANQYLPLFCIVVIFVFLRNGAEFQMIFSFSGLNSSRCLCDGGCLCLPNRGFLFTDFPYCVKCYSASANAFLSRGERCRCTLVCTVSFIVERNLVVLGRLAIFSRTPAVIYLLNLAFIFIAKRLHMVQVRPLTSVSF